MVKLWSFNFFVRKQLEYFSETISWSFLGHIGQSKAVKLTILMPFVGYLIFFNSHIKDFLEISYINLNSNHNSIDQNGKMEIVTFNRLIFVYFGLLSLGIGSVLYSIFAPEEIKQNPLANNYVIFYNTIATPEITKFSLNRLLRLYSEAGTDEERSRLFRFKPLNFPRIVADRLHSFIEKVYDNTDFGEEGKNPGINEFLQRFRSGSGYILTDQIVMVMYRSLKVISYFSRLLINVAINYRNDVFFIEHLAMTYSKFFLRLTTFVFFVLGFLFLSIPTLETTFRILWDLLEH